MTSTGSGSPQLSNAFAVVGDAYKNVSRIGDNFFPSQCSAAAFNELLGVVQFIGAVNVDIYTRSRV